MHIDVITPDEIMDFVFCFVSIYQIFLAAPWSYGLQSR
jgi:hypothetical protein